MKPIMFSIYFILFLCIMGGENIAHSAEHLDKYNSDNLINTFSYYNTPDKYQGCTCAFNLNTSSDSLVFISKIPERENTLMKIDGKFVYLQSKKPRNDAMDIMGITMTKNIGDKLNYEYIADEINVSIELKATSVCPPDYEGCEAQNYLAIITVIKGKRQQTIRANGNCGC